MGLDVDAATMSGSWWRHVPAGADPAGRPDPPGDNRWQRGQLVDAVYLVDEDAGAWAEWYRYLAEAAIPPMASLPRDLWRYELSTVEVADLTDDGRLSRVGLGTPRPGRAGWVPFQAVGEQLYREGWRGLVVPSAARPSSRVVALFIPDGRLPSELAAAEATRVVEPPVPPRGMRTSRCDDLLSRQTSSCR